MQINLEGVWVNEDRLEIMYAIQKLGGKAVFISEIAHMVNKQRPNVSLIMAKMKKQGLISYEKGRSLKPKVYSLTERGQKILDINLD